MCDSYPQSAQGGWGQVNVEWMALVLAIHHIHHPDERDGVEDTMPRKPDSLLRRGLNGFCTSPQTSEVRLLFPRSAWEHKGLTLRVSLVTRRGSGETDRREAERRKPAFPRRAWEREGRGRLFEV